MLTVVEVVVDGSIRTVVEVVVDGVSVVEVVVDGISVVGACVVFMTESLETNLINKTIIFCPA